MRMLFVMDPLNGIKIAKDTTFAFLLEAQRRGHEVWACEPRLISATGAGAYVRAQQVAVQRVEGAHYDVLREERHPLSAFRAVFMRKDPPFNMDYLYTTFLLEQVDASKTLVINKPQGLRNANEKAFILNFPSVIPETIVAQSRREIRRFVDDVGGKAVIKPLDQMGGTGIFLLRNDDPNLNSILETSTSFGTEYVMVQRYVPEAKRGDKRVILMDGKPLGAVLRVPTGVEFRGNMAAGGTAQKTTLSERDLEIIEVVAPRLRAEGLWFVGLDIIGDYVTEVNVTSPTGVQEIDRLDGATIERDIFDWVEDACA